MFFNEMFFKTVFTAIINWPTNERNKFDLCYLGEPNDPLVPVRNRPRQQLVLMSILANRLLLFLVI